MSTDFLGFNCKYIPYGNSGASAMQIEKPYQYRCILEQGMDPIYQPLGKQARLNLVKRSLELNTQKKFAFWHDLHDKDDIDKRIKEFCEQKLECSIDLVPCNIEDFLNDKVFHQKKSDDLLKLISDRLSGEDSTGIYPIKPLDLIACNIPIHPRDLGSMQLQNEEKYWDSKEGIGVLSYLKNEELIRLFGGKNQDSRKDLNYEVSITTKGWNYLGSLNHTISKKVFIAMDFSSWETDDKIIEKDEVIAAIKRACRNNGFDADIVSQNHTGYIVDKIKSEIKQSRFVICDFTYNNRGVYYESGYAEGLGKAVYHIMKKGQKFETLHFDIRQLNCREWESPEMLAEMLSNWIHATENFDR